MDPPKVYSRPPPRRIPKLIPIAIAAIFAIIIIIIIIYIYQDSVSDSLKFGIVIDGGSTGTRIHVLAYKVIGSEIPIIDFGSGGSVKVGPGLSTYAEDPEAAGESLVELMEFGKGRVPREWWAETEVRLMGTAGLRMVGEKAREKILESCRNVLRSSGFRFEDGWASVISGR